MSTFANRLDRFFHVAESGSTVRREVIGGITTFATMSYIVFVQPTVLSAAGMPFGSVLMATCLSSAIACFLMGALARYPIALAPGMGENFLFAFTICGTMGFSYPAGLAIVFISGVLFMLLSLFAVRERMLDILPDCLKNSIGPAIGLFIAFIGFQWGGIIVHSSSTMVTMGNFHRAIPLITIFGVLFITVLMAVGIRGAILPGILACWFLGLLTHTLPGPSITLKMIGEVFLSIMLAAACYVLVNNMLTTRKVRRAGAIALGAALLALLMALQIFTPVKLIGLPQPPRFETFFNLNFDELWQRWDKSSIAIALFFFLVLFDTVGTLIGVGKQAGYMTEDGRLQRAGRAFFSDAAGTCVGALFGTSTVTSYVESAAGVAAGARTGLAAAVTGVCFILAIVFGPAISFVGQDVGAAFYGADSGLTVRMHPAVAPALIVVGFLMMSPLRRVNWDDITEGFPAFLTVAMMVFGYGITEGVAMGCISYAFVKLMAGRGREVHPIMYLVAFALLLRYALLVPGH